MKLKGAKTILKKECNFLGLTLTELLVFIERNPYAQNHKTIEAYKVWYEYYWPDYIGRTSEWINDHVRKTV